MENNEFYKVRIENRTCYYFDDIIKLEDFDFDNFLIDEKSHEHILIYGISYKTLIYPKPLRIRWDKIDGFIRIYDGTRYLTLFDYENYDAIYKCKKWHHISKLILMILVDSNLVKIKVDSYDSLPIEKAFTLHNIIILIKSVLNKDQYHYYYEVNEKILLSIS